MLEMFRTIYRSTGNSDLHQALPGLSCLSWHLLPAVGCQLGSQHLENFWARNLSSAAFLIAHYCCGQCSRSWHDMKSTTNHRWYRCSCRSLQRWSPSVRALLQCCGDQVQFHDTCLGFGWVRSIGKFSMAHPTSPSPLAPSFLSENLHFLWFQWHGKPFPSQFFHWGCHGSSA